MLHSFDDGVYQLSLLQLHVLLGLCGLSSGYNQLVQLINTNCGMCDVGCVIVMLP